MKLFIIYLVSWLSLLCNIALAQFDASEGLTGSTSFPEVAITSLGNLAVFLTCLVRGSLHAEMGARDLLDCITGPKLHDIRGFGLTTCCYMWEENANVMGLKWSLNLGAAEVVMLSKDKPSCSMWQFMKYTSHVYDVPSIQLQSRPLIISGQVPACHPDPISQHACHCIVLKTVPEITMMLAERIPGTLKQLSDSECLLPCLSCLTNSCHGCNQGLLHVEEVEDLEAGRENVDEEEAGRKIRKKILTEGCRKDWPVAAVCKILDDKDFEQRNCCICIPTHPAENDKWTEMLITSLKTKDKDARGVINLTSDAMQNYIAQCGVCDDKEEYGTLSLIVSRLAEALVNIIVTVWLRVDGFSSALIARRAIRDYIVDSRGSGIAGNAFLSKCRVYSNVENTNVCQVLTFRGSLLSFGTFSIIITCVNLLCSITWAVLIALEGGTGKWYEPEAMPLSKPRVYVIMIAIALGLAFSVFDSCFVFFRGGRREDNGTEHLYRKDHDNGTEHGFGWRPNVLICYKWKNGLTCLFMVSLAGISVITTFETLFLILGERGHLRVHGTWIYAALQALVWMRWGVGVLVSTLTYKEYSSEYNRETARRGMIRVNRLAYASTFLLNAIFLGVRGSWIRGSTALVEGREHSN